MAAAAPLLILGLLFLGLLGPTATGGVLRWDLVSPAGDPPPLMLTPAHVEGEWPFRAPEVEVSCCIGGQISIQSEGQSYWFEGGRHYAGSGNMKRDPVAT